MKEEKYLYVVWGDVDPEIFGPFKDENERFAEACRIFKEEGEERNGIFMLDIKDGKLYYEKKEKEFRLCL